MKVVLSELSLIASLGARILCLAMQQVLQKSGDYDPVLVCDWKELLALVRGGESRGKRAKEKRAIPTTPMIDADPVAEDAIRRFQHLWKAVVAPLTDKYMKSAQEKYLNTSAMFSLETVFRI